MPGSPDNSDFGPVETIFQAALDLVDETERRAYLSEACAHAPALRQRVEELLNAHREAAARGTFLPEHRLAVRFEKAGDRIGSYTLLEELGAGAFGVVWRASQEKPFRREVALKIIKAGMDTAQVMARFEAERQALALMDHPHIAKVFDAGATETGRPYFVMELVRGGRITDYCDEHHLATHDRLLLFAQVCRALQHAHAKGVVHRDIKPSNVLVCRPDPGSLGAPKVIDFGIAKAVDHRLTEETIVTATGQFLGTPAYMSPEQAGMNGQDIDARSDLYSLGLLLYELLTGRLPVSPAELQRLPLDEALRTIRQKEPPPPSTRLAALTDRERTTVAQCRQTEPAALRRLLRTELDCVVMKCLEKDRARRYQTAGELAEDIQCHLDHRPLRQARPPGLWARLRRMLGRPKAAGAAGCAALASLALLLTWNHSRQTEWRQFPIRVMGYDQPWDCFWSGMTWAGTNGWLIGAIDPQGGGDHLNIGKGVLLQTTDGGRHWAEFNVTNIESGTGTNGHYHNEVWTQVGPLTQVHIEAPLQRDGRTRRTNGLLASWTGIYATTNAVSPIAKWSRLTPRPDLLDNFGRFEGLMKAEGFPGIYAFGWQGIAHGGEGEDWQVEKETGDYPIYALVTSGSDLWAAGGGGQDESGGTGANSPGAIYRQRRQRRAWEPVPLPGIQLHPRQHIRDLVWWQQTQTLFAVGPAGLILRGSPAGANWVWTQLRSGTVQDLCSITRDDNLTLWAVGSHGTILRSPDQGESWTEVPAYRGWWHSRVRNELHRIVFFGNRGWILGVNVVLRLNGQD